MRSTNHILELMDDQVAQDRKAERIELESFRKNYQQTNLRRDFDLYDPNALKKDFPARVNDSDQRCGISGMQRFEGEDAAVKKRLQLQKEQMKTWTLEQMHQKEVNALEELNEKKRYEEFQRNIVIRWMHFTLQSIMLEKNNQNMIGIIIYSWYGSKI